MTKLHVDELDIDAGLVRRLLAAQFPQWADLTIEPFPAGGTVNVLYRLGADMEVRPPTNPVMATNARYVIHEVLADYRLE